jgi:lipoprotein signal peptidase
MFFSWAARIVAVIVLVLSVFKFGVAMYIARSSSSEYLMYEASRYLGSGTTGQHIDRAIYQALIAIALDTLAEISFSLRANRNK